MSPARLRFVDLVRFGVEGLRQRRSRTLLTALGIAIGVASLVAVVGITQSSKAGLLAELDALGTNLLRVAPGQTALGQQSFLPDEAPSMIRRIEPVEQAAATSQLATTVRRSDVIPRADTRGLSVLAVEPTITETLGVDTVVGLSLDDAPEGVDGVVVGAVAAERLGIRSLVGAPRVFIDDRWFGVLGILEPARLAPEIDRAVLMTYGFASNLYDDVSPTTVYVRTNQDQVDEVEAALAATANPEHPNEVSVSRPSDVLAARAATDKALTAQLLGLGAVALFVGGLGIANVMVIGVLERRAEIGIRRAIGATKRDIRNQFLLESTALAAMGGATGLLMGAATTLAFAAHQDWDATIPLTALLGGFALSVVVGAIAGWYPATRAARLSPAQTISSAG